MVKFSAITLPALLATLAALSAAAPTPNTSSDIVTADAVAVRDVEPVDFSVDDLEARAVPEDTIEAVSIETRHNHGSSSHWGYDGHWWYKKSGKWYKDSSKYDQNYDQGYKMSHHMSYYGRDGYMYEWKSNNWYKTNSYNSHYDSKHWNGNYKRDASEVEARDVEVEATDFDMDFAVAARDIPADIETPDFDIEVRDVDTEIESSDFALEARTNGDKHKDHKDYYSYHGYLHHWNGKSWEKHEYNGWYNKEHKPYYKDGYLYEYSVSSHCYQKYGNYNKSYKDGWAY